MDEYWRELTRVNKTEQVSLRMTTFLKQKPAFHLAEGQESPNRHIHAGRKSIDVLCQPQVTTKPWQVNLAYRSLINVNRTSTMCTWQRRGQVDMSVTPRSDISCMANIHKTNVCLSRNWKTEITMADVRYKNWNRGHRWHPVIDISPLSTRVTFSMSPNLILLAFLKSCLTEAHCLVLPWQRWPCTSMKS